MSSNVQDPSPSLLLVEDDNGIATVVEIALQNEPFQLFRARDAEEAMTYISTQSPQILLTDLNLASGLNGRELAIMMRNECDALAVVLISGAFDQTMQVDTVLPNSIALPKPFRKAMLIAAIQKALQMVKGL